MTHRVILWTAPRSVSTAFERAMMEKENCKTFHEPYSHAYYFGPERLSQRFKDHDVDQNATFKNISQTLLKDYDGVDLVFCKEMAFFVINHISEILAEGMRNCRHSFLIRDPRKSVPSLYDISVNRQTKGWGDFDPQQCGFQELVDLYEILTEKLDEKPVIVDADDLLENPEGVMQAYCKATGITFEEDMLRWKPGPVCEWNQWADWHKDAMNSSGFKRQEQAEDLGKDSEKHPMIFKQTIEKCFPLYEELYRHRLILK